MSQSPAQLAARQVRREEAEVVLRARAKRILAAQESGATREDIENEYGWTERQQRYALDFVRRGRTRRTGAELEGFEQTRQLKAEAQAHKEARIRHLLAQSETQADIARAVGVQPSFVSRIAKGGK